MKDQTAWITRDGKRLTVDKIDDLYLVNICKHIIWRLEMDLDVLDYYNSSYAPLGQVAFNDAEQEVSHATMEYASLKGHLKFLTKELKKRGLEAPKEKKHIKRWK